ncbi:hypothetical protein Psal006b_00222 [Piscirickettsia salmonis]|uniref:Uncharacterized protein n=1 Tax=Piscirickettsia salmonis TaxID=1238 RepID=A0A1L6TF54_PISSA|nr:hypothetical protein [Piscirickettsia salmonis]AKP72412.1 hypothetical protein PSLF89_230 [Piscirickettsia salmonis LF-89 = ATCC VR-1361]ALB24131.1 hypothetical protein KU39_2956 [Piscirickettsia salmonis]ALY03938.1 hypothetical protein AWE47_14575 [Piscirickettsia salmonis]AMA43499.1 hypothetical protein AWJ11_14790 [Piscirickettsia salmonis]AOS35968.1 hypothetical protein AVM72_11905 [Piscirickettsia salmonis]
MPSSRFDPQALTEIATLYTRTYQRDNLYHNPDNEYGKLYTAAQKLDREARRGEFSEEESARVLKGLLSRINDGFKYSLKRSDLGYKIQETLRQFYDLSPNHINPPQPSVGHIAQRGLNGPYLPALKAYELQETYLGKNLNDLFILFEGCKQKTKAYSEFSNADHRTAIKKEILRQVETCNIDQSLTEQAIKVLAYHSSFTGIGKTSSTKESLKNPQVFTQLYTADSNPKILTKTQRQLVDEFNQTKSNQQLSTKDKSSALKKLKYALVHHIARSGKLEGVELEEVNEIIDYKRDYFALTTNTRDYVSKHPRLNKILPPPKMFQRLFQKAAEAQQPEQTPTAEGEVGHTPC